ncbi:winged helix-turn-helix domain-containing protein [Pantoea dispersa]|nr:winged helix-turn-helix domain-containing protein [Pantoea dispersa]
MDTTVDRNTPYTSRPWITTALSLRFNDALTYREIAEQLNVSTSATHKMFKRFLRTGINCYQRCESGSSATWVELFRPEDSSPSA